MSILQRIPFIAVTILIAGCSGPKEIAKTSALTAKVDPFIGTAGHGHVFLGASVPFGGVQLGPNNIETGWDWCSGYHYSSTNIIGFSHTHLSGTGGSDLGDILLMPTTGKIQLLKGTIENPESGFASRFSHMNEVAKPGYYKVLLDKYHITAELTASARVGFHRYTFPDTGQNHILIDLGEGIQDKPTRTNLKIVNDSTLLGYRYSTGWAKDQRLFFAIVFSKPFIKTALYDSTAVQQGMEASGSHIKGVMDFTPGASRQVLVKVGISPVSVENALDNIKAEIPAWDFDAEVRRADQLWEKELQKVAIKADTATEKVFYTALYHTMIAPSAFNDHNGDYRGADMEVHKNASFTNLTTYSLWDTYRATHPLYTILQTERVHDMIQSMLAIYQQTGWLPVWHLVGNETGTMIGYHAVPPIVDAWMKGIPGIDANLAYEAIRKSAMGDSRGLKYLKELGYIPADKEGESVAKAMEYAIDDWCIAEMAKSLHKEDDYQYFLKRSRYYQTYFDKNTRFVRGKESNGKWREPFNPISSVHRADDYTEGNAWQYTWLAPQDPEGLIALFGGEKNFTQKLDSLFLVKEKLPPGSSPDISGLIGQYAQGNEPGHHTTYLYSFAGQPWKTAEKVRFIMDSLYTTGPKGLCGNEDVGQMSSWYIFSSLGFYPVNPANGMYVFGSPAVNEAVLHLPDGKDFHMLAKNNDSKNIYIQSATLNGKPYNKSYMMHADIMKGGELVLVMGDKPSSTWGVAPETRPESIFAEKKP